MKLAEIIKILQEKYSPELASSFDIGKIGLQFGTANAEVKKIMVALDGTSAVVDEAIENHVDLLLTHHPFMFNPMISLNYDSPFGVKMLKVFKNKLNIYAMHTNFDTAVDGMNDMLARKLNLANIHAQKEEIDGSCFLRIGDTTPMDLEEYVQIVLEKLNEPGARVVGNHSKKIKKVGIVGGAGASELMLAKNLGCDCLITGEIRHNNAIDAIENNFAIIEVSHSIEALFKEYIKKELEQILDGVEIVTSKVEKDPFRWISKK